MPPADLERFSDLVGLIYDAALEPKLWSRVLEGVTSAVEGASGLFFTPMHDAASGGFAYLAGVPETFQQQYAAKWAPHDIWLQAAMGKGLLQSGIVTSDEDLLPRKKLLESDYYRGFLKPANVSRLCASVIFGADAVGMRPSMISVYKGTRARPFSSDAMTIARMLNPHLSRSLGMMYRLQDAEFRVASSRAALERLVSAVILLGEGGVPLFVNPAARNILDARDGLYLREVQGVGPQLAGETAEATTRIARVVASALDPDVAAVPHFVEGVRLARAGGRPPLILSVSALSQHNEFGYGRDRPGAIVFIHDPARPQLNSKLLREVYALTEAETAVVIGICSGQNIADLARQRDVSENTIKTQLDSVFAKTGTNRQSDLVRVALSLSSGAT